MLHSNFKCMMLSQLLLLSASLIPGNSIGCDVSVASAALNMIVLHKFGVVFLYNVRVQINELFQFNFATVFQENIFSARFSTHICTKCGFLI